MIKIPKSLSIGKIDKLYHELASSEDSAIDIQLPQKIDKLDFSILFSLIQFISTWIRNERSRTLHLPVKGEDEAISYLYDNEFVYPAIVLSWEKDILDDEGKNVKTKLREPSKDYYAKMDFFELKGLSVPIFCFDHDKSNRGLSKNFYNNKREIVNEDVLGFNLYRAYQKIGSHNPSIFKDNIRRSLDSLNAIIHELFLNTHEHAKTNELGHNIYPNIRAVHIKFHKKTINKLIEDYKNFQGLVSYFNSGFNLNETHELYLIEISILDSGPGLYKRYRNSTSYDVSISQEVEIIKECLYRHSTSTSSVRRELKGLGLDRVLQTIDGRGFVRIKSGRVDVFRDMKAHRYIHHATASEIQLYDYHNNSKNNFTILPSAEGTLISIFYPLDYKQ